LDGKSNGKSDGTVFAIAVDKNAPSSRTYLANTARDAVVSQAKNRSPVHPFTY
jgi:NAD+--asparagine ADP-ribosyltransferase